MKTKHSYEKIGIRSLRTSLKDVLERVDNKKQRIIVGKHGTELAALIPMSDLLRVEEMELIELKNIKNNNQRDIENENSSKADYSIDDMMSEHIYSEPDKSRYVEESELEKLGSDLDLNFDQENLSKIEHLLLDAIKEGTTLSSLYRIFKCSLIKYNQMYSEKSKMLAEEHVSEALLESLKRAAINFKNSPKYKKLYDKEHVVSLEFPNRHSLDEFEG
jgi:prevent-host-death family protein